MCSICKTSSGSHYDKKVHRIRDVDAGQMRIYLDFEYRRLYCWKCQGVKREAIPWMAKSSRHTQRLEDTIGHYCRSMTASDVAKLYHMSWDQVWRLDMAYMERLVEEHPPSKHLRAVGFDEVSVRKGQSYVIIGADLDQQRPIWVSEELGRSEEDMDKFYDEMGPGRCRRIRLGVMDMWPAFRNSLERHCPKAEIVFDKFHVLKHLSDALDLVRRMEYKRVAEKDRRFIKGQRYTLLSHKANLDMEGRRSLALLLKANKRLSKAYVLKESFGQLWDYNNPTWARKFFENWKAQLKWSRLAPFEKFAGMVERHWGGIVSYCNPDHKVSLGFMEGLNNKIRVIQRRAYGIRNMHYLRLKVITSFIGN